MGQLIYMTIYYLVHFSLLDMFNVPKAPVNMWHLNPVCLIPTRAENPTVQCRPFYPTV